MNRETILEWLLYRGAAVVLILIMYALLYFILYSVPMYDLRSLLLHNEIIVYHAKAVACVGAIPLCIYSIFVALRVFFTKGVKPPTTQTSIGKVCSGVCVIVTFLSFIIAFLIPIGLAFSPYSNCPQEKLGNYYVTDLELCKNIEPRNWKIERHE
ncbi:MULTISPECIES: DUF1240 domain-containing protein [Buttiauxella]|uniref:DUF1240 domain-containing protein n=1 Tax=Buttiauxella TaxID=82976 RepID=UPI00156118D2|nr:MULTISPECIES: DUF1240 domain-containing protein [Buttiauxella]MCS3604876.1 succinate dehydrogenase hydrophobic anchor subunit [Buttiauxella sp. BIGb0471]